MCQDLNHFQDYLRHFVLAKLAISNIRVKMDIDKVNQGHD